jgi:uncharacterized membrane protein YhdT
VLVGLLNFHPPHFLLEPAGQVPDAAGQALEALLAADLAAALIAAAGIYRDRRWAWRLGIAIAGLGVALYALQETIGLPGLPRQWWEPSRLLTLALEVAFVIMAVRADSSSRRGRCTRGGRGT